MRILSAIFTNLLIFFSLIGAGCFADPPDDAFLNSNIESDISNDIADFEVLTFEPGKIPSNAEFIQINSTNSVADLRFRIT